LKLSTQGNLAVLTVSHKAAQTYGVRQTPIIDGRLMKLKIFLMITVILFMSIGCSSPEESESDIDAVPIDTSINPGDSIIAYKPNIYIYPESEIDLNVRLTFPNGGRVIVSEPLYNGGWSTHVTEEGLIDNKFTFLFYECKTPDFCQYDEGWIVEKPELASFFENELQTLKFNEVEIQDFLDHWLPLLKEHNQYIIYPQYSEILEQMVTIDCDIEPDIINRIWYVVREYDGDEQAPRTPDSEVFSREGFYIMEWGLIL